MRETTGPRLSILESLKRRGPMTIDRLRDEFDLSKTAMRAHLLRLEEGGMIERVELAQQGPGRPPLAYRITERGSGVFPSDDGAILTGLLAFLERAGAAGLVHDFFEALWAERLGDLRRRLGVEILSDRSLGDRLAALEELLAEGNFMPAISSTPCEGGTQVVVQECNCPLPAAVRASRVPCELEKSFLEQALGVPVGRVSIASRRSEPCRFEFIVDRS